MKNSDFKMPKWMECSWRRQECGKMSCKLCGRIMKDRQRHIEAGEDPDDMAVVFKDVAKYFEETIQMVKAKAEELGIDISDASDIPEPPEPKEFPLYRKAEQWRVSVAKLIEQAYESEDLWPHTEEGLDLSWYKNTICTKVYRQLVNRWEMERGDEHGEFDYEYTKDVLKERLKIVKNSLSELARMQLPSKLQFFLALANLQALEHKILHI